MSTIENETFTYTPDMTRPYCATCGTPVDGDTDTPEIEWEATCRAGHTHTYQLDNDDLSECLETTIRGTSEQEYEIYRSAAEDLGWTVKTFDQWLSS